MWWRIYLVGGIYVFIDWLIFKNCGEPPFERTCEGNFLPFLIWTSSMFFPVVIAIGVLCIPPMETGKKIVDIIEKKLK